MNVYKSVESATPTTDHSVCDTCAPAIVNDDYSAFDDDDELASVTAFVESVRDYLMVIGDTDYAGYWTCEACGQMCIGTGVLLGVLA